MQVCGEGGAQVPPWAEGQRRAAAQQQAFAHGIAPEPGARAQVQFRRHAFFGRPGGREQAQSSAIAQRTRRPQQGRPLPQIAAQAWLVAARAGSSDRACARRRRPAASSRPGAAGGAPPRDPPPCSPAAARSSVARARSSRGGSRRTLPASAPGPSSRLTRPRRPSTAPTPTAGTVCRSTRSSHGQVEWNAVQEGLHVPFGGAAHHGVGVAARVHRDAGRGQQGAQVGQRGGVLAPDLRRRQARAVELHRRGLGAAHHEVGQVDQQGVGGRAAARGVDRRDASRRGGSGEQQE